MRLPVPVAAGLVALVGVILLILGITGHSVRFDAFGVGLIAAAVVAFVGAASARTTVPGEIQPGVAFEGMPWWALIAAGVLIAAGAIVGIVAGH